MREYRSYGSVRGALGNWRPYRDFNSFSSLFGCASLFPEEPRIARWPEDDTDRIPRATYRRVPNVNVIGPLPRRAR
jgi:hypothetical protein